jgi:ABC-2 type transport system permease protein
VRIRAIVTTALLRFARDRSNIFFVFIFPLAIVLLIGLQYSEAPTPRLGVVAGDQPLSLAIVDRLDTSDHVDVIRYHGHDPLVRHVEDGDIDAGLIIPTDLDARTAGGEASQLGFITAPFGVGPQLRSLVDDALAEVLAIPTAVHAAVERGADPGQAALVATEQEPLTRLIAVSTTTTGDRLFPEELTGYDIGAAGQLVLFMFLTSLAGSAAMIQSRRLGVTSRMLSTPTSVGTIILGEASARFAIAVTQGVYIMVATVVLFDVNWGNLVAAATILTAFGAVGAAAAMLSGSVFENDEQASGIMIILALGMGALGGSMLPVELFSDTMLGIARAIPHFWALDAFAEVVRRDGTVIDILPQLGILLGFAAVIGAVAVWRLRRTLTHT